MEVLTTKNYLWSNHTIPKVLELSFSQEKLLENVSSFAILTTAPDFLMHNHVTGVCIVIVSYIRSYFSTVDHLSPTSLNPQTQTATIEEQSAFKFPEVRNLTLSFLSLSCYNSYFNPMTIPYLKNAIFYKTPSFTDMLSDSQEPRDIMSSQ